MVNNVTLPNGLDLSTSELLEVLQEEAAEVIFEICKTKRHGLHSYNPFEIYEGTNSARMSKEIEQFLAIAIELRNRNIISFSTDSYILKQRYEDKLQWMHHQKG